MRLVSFLNEGSVEIIRSLAITYIKRHAMEVVSLYKRHGKNLYTGRKNIREPIYVHRVKNRIPKDMDFRIHKDINEFFNKKFGVRARSECLFTTADYKIAAGYGHPYIVVPLGKYKIIWSEEIFDLFAYLEDFKYIPVDPYRNRKVKFKISQILTLDKIEDLEFLNTAHGVQLNLEEIKFVNRNMKNIHKEIYLELMEKYQSGSIEDLFNSKSSNEVMIHCEKFLLLDYPEGISIFDEIH